MQEQQQEMIAGQVLFMSVVVKALAEQGLVNVEKLAAALSKKNSTENDDRLSSQVYFAMLQGFLLILEQDPS